MRSENAMATAEGPEIGTRDVAGQEVARQHSVSQHTHDVAGREGDDREADASVGARVSWAETRAASLRDRAHWRRRAPDGGRLIWLHRGYQAAFVYRLCRYAHERGWKLVAWVLWIVNIWLTGADIPPSTRIAGGLYLPHPNGAVIAGAVGHDVAFGPQASIGGLFKAPDRDVGGGPGLPRLGDDVILEAGAIVLGAVLVGDRCHVGPRCLVLKDMDPDTEIQPQPWRVLPGRSAES